MIWLFVAVGRYTAEDHTALASSGILEAVSSILNASHVKKQLVQVGRCVFPAVVMPVTCLSVVGP
jgi:hypothetical protein